MQFTDEQLKIAISKLDEFPELKCEICGGIQWTIEKDIHSVDSYRGPNEKTTFSIPSVVLICNKCGNIKLLSAIRLGVVSKETPTGDFAESPSSTNNNSTEDGK